MLPYCKRLSQGCQTENYSASITMSRHRALAESPTISRKENIILQQYIATLVGRESRNVHGDREIGRPKKYTIFNAERTHKLEVGLKDDDRFGGQVPWFRPATKNQLHRQDSGLITETNIRQEG